MSRCCFRCKYIVCMQSLLVDLGIIQNWRHLFGDETRDVAYDSARTCDSIASRCCDV